MYLRRLKSNILLFLALCCMGRNERISAQALEANETIVTGDGYRLERFDSTSKNQPTAKDICKGRGLLLDPAKLVRIKSQEMQYYVSYLTRNSTSGGPNNYWIGLEYINGDWYWNDDTLLTEDFWSPGEPGDGSSTGCTSVQPRTDTWISEYCTDIRRLICQSELIYIKVEEKEVACVEGDNVIIGAIVATLNDTVDVNLYKLTDLEDPIKTTSVSAESKNGERVNYTIVNVLISDAGEYSFVATAQTYPYYNRSSTTKIVVQVPANITEIAPLSIRSPVTRGKSYVNCIAYGIPTPNVTWTRSGINVQSGPRDDGVYQIAGESKSSLHVENAILTDEGSYSCEATNVIKNSDLNKDTAESYLTVLGPPTIISTIANDCGEESKITIHWKPNNQTRKENHTVEVVNMNDTAAQNMSRTINPNGKETINTEIKELSAYTTYNITVTVCPDDCINKLGDSSSVMTPPDVPNVVTNATVTQNESQPDCYIRWKWTDIYQLKDVDFNIYENYTSLTSDGKIYSNASSYNGDSLNSFVVQVETEPNRNYTFSITVSSCAGESAEVEVAGICIRDVTEPETVPTPRNLKQTNYTQPIEVQIPSETNGAISCIFVVMVSGENPTLTEEFTEGNLEEISQAAANPQNDTEYLAAARSRLDIPGDSFVVYLGDRNETSCNPNETLTRTGGYAAVNLPLTRGVKYTYYTLTTTPYQTKDGTAFQRSAASSFTFGVDPTETTTYQSTIQQTSQAITTDSWWWIVLIVVGVLVILIIIGFIYYRTTCRKTKDPSNEEETRSVPLTSNHIHYEDDSPLSEVAPEQEKSTRISKARIRDRFESLNRNNGQEFTKQFLEIKNGSDASLPTEMASRETVRKKNRYKNVLPYDETRVKLSGDDVQSYINACYIQGFSQERKFIATQGPLNATVDDFWRMVAENGTTVIVMLTNTEEGGKKKCAKYWPDAKKKATFGGLTVINKEEQYYGGFMKRILDIKTQDNEDRTVEQFQYLKWPDHGVPVTTSSFVRLHRACMASRGNATSPIIVHCSAGAGRTGAFIGYDNLLDEIEQTKHIDVCNCVKKMRSQRMDMVQTCGQYKLLHRLLLEYSMFGETDMEASEMKAKKRNQSKIAVEFNNVEEASKISKIEADEAKNFFDVVILWAPGDGEAIPRYEAAYVENYYNEAKIIAAKGPAANEIEKFWRIVLDNEVKYIVMINPESGKPVPYWSNVVFQNASAISVELAQAHDMDRITERRLTVRRSNQEEEVIQYQILKWTPDVITRVVSKIKGAAHTAINSRSNVIVHCSDGKGRTGVFCAIVNLTERYEKEGKVDVFRAVKDLRDCRDGLVQTQEEYKFCYDVIAHTLEHKPATTYENFSAKMQTTL